MASSLMDWAGSWDYLQFPKATQSIVLTGAPASVLYARDLALAEYFNDLVGEGLAGTGVLPRD
jgi:hypothetical protein